MATSVALTNSDILSLVFECITLPPLDFLVYGAEARADLARAAVVCVAFHEPATRLLWKDLTGLIPLLSLLPSSLTKVKAVGKRMFWDTHILNGNVDPQEWKHMCRRAEYVQRLDLRVSEKRIELATRAYLSHLTQGHPLLPNLRRLDCSFDSPQSILIIRPLLSPNLTHLYIECDLDGDGLELEWERSLRSFFHVVCSIATRLNHIDFNSTPRGRRVPFPLTIFSPIRQLQFLRTVLLDWSTSSVIDLQSLRSVLSGMESLEDISLTVPVPGWTLRNLRKLEIDFHLPPTVFDKLYNSLDSPNLRELRDFSHSLTVEECVTRSTTIARRFPRLQVLLLFMGFQEPRESFSLGLIMQSLSTLRGITSFTLYICGAQDVTTDADIHALAEAWPLLETFPAALVSLATQCPTLGDLSLTSLNIPESDLSRLADYPVLDHSLKSLVTFERFGFADCQYAASLLDRLFPHLDLSKPSFSDFFVGETPTPLGARLRALQAARMQHELRLDAVSTGEPQDNEHIYLTLKIRPRQVAYLCWLHQI
ncbi:hypothetical protein V8D89_005497 [Ganoderma adspersum]